MAVATGSRAAALSEKPAGSPFGHHPRHRGAGRARGMAAALVAAFCILLVPSVADGASNKVRLTSLGDLSFGTVSDLTSDAVQSESVCIYADTASNGYNVTAIGTGAGGAFQLSSGLQSLPFEVQWSNASGRTSGVQLDPNVPLTGQTSGATQQTCNNGPASTASLVVLLPASALSSATAGSYSGTLTLVLGAE
jgi:hypothetical protein